MEGHIFKAHVYGYEHGLDGKQAFWTGTIDRLFTSDPMITHHDHKRLCDAFADGVRDGYRRYIQLHPEKFITPEEAAQQRGIALNNLLIFLRNDKRSSPFLFKSFVEGEGKRRQWYLHIDDVAAFKFRAKKT